MHAPVSSSSPKAKIRLRWTIGFIFQSILIAPLFLGAALGFKTEPDFKRHEKFDISVTHHEQHSLWPAQYLMLDVSALGVHRYKGPEIYDAKTGHLVWQGPSNHASQNLHVCDYLEQNGTHLCFFHWERQRKPPSEPNTFPPDLEAPKRKNWPRLPYGRNIVLDSSYNEAEDGNFTYMFHKYPINSHTFRMVKGGKSFITAVTKPAYTDLTPYGCPTRGSWVQDQCIDEKDIATGKSVFHWCYLERGLEMWETYTFFESKDQKTNATSRKVGGCFDNLKPWDFLHVNAVDKTSDGDYLVSIRHLNQILKIAGPDNTDSPPGGVIWRLGGKSGDFKMENFAYDTPFARQHDVQIISSSGSETLISIFSNGWDGAMAKTQDSSEAQIININTDTMTARLEHRYPHPQGKITAARGSAEVEPNGNIFVGWGEIPQCSEFSRDGKLLSHWEFEWPGQRRPFTYRCRKGDWKGEPYYPPKLVAYSRTCDELATPALPITAYVSWNGATEIRRWRFRSAPARGGPWHDHGAFHKRGFETLVKLQVPEHKDWPRQTIFISVQALGKDGQALSDEVVEETFVPKAVYQSQCGKTSCGNRSFAYTRDKAETCSAPGATVSSRVRYLGLAILLFYIEAFGFFSECAPLFWQWDRSILADTF